MLILLCFITLRITMDQTPSISPEKPNIIIIVMDTARQDRLSCYDYHRRTSPNLELLSENSTLFTKAYSTSGWTPPAHASLFTGLFPIAHKTTQENPALSAELKTLAEILTNQGYETIGITENPMVSRHFQFHRGFSVFIETWKRFFIKEPVHINPAYKFFNNYIEHRKKSENKKPFFVFINFIEPHNPYDSSHQFMHSFTKDDSIKCNNNRWQKHFLGLERFSPKEINHLNALYDAEILYVDHWIGKIAELLKKVELWNDTLFIVTSDHGENIGHHDMMDHVFSIYESTVKIPLIIHFPPLFPENKKINDPVQLTDIFPTIIDILNLDSSAFPSQGRSLLHETSPDRSVFVEYYYPEQVLSTFDDQERLNPNLEKFKRIQRAVIRSDWKLLFRSDGDHELYHLKNDPDESENLINHSRFSNQKKQLIRNLEKLKALYEKNAVAEPGVADSELDSATKERLKILGYSR